jgi:hypothetical protein
MRLLDPRFRYVPAAHTDVSSTWRRFGFRPTTDSERRARQRTDLDAASVDAPADVELAPPPTRAVHGGKQNLKLAR